MSASGPLNGFLLTRVDGANVSAFDLEGCPYIEHLGKISGTGWDEYKFACPVLIPGEHIGYDGPPFNYTIVCRHSGPRLLLLAHRRQIADHLVDHMLPEYVFPNLERVKIDVPRIINLCLSKTFAYKLTSAHGRFNGSGGALKSTSFYGENLSRSKVFRNVAGAFDFFSCGLGKSLIREEDQVESLHEARRQGEIVRLGNDGFVSVFFKDTRRAQAVEAVLRYLKKMQLIKA